MDTAQPTHPFEFWWIPVFGALGAGLGVVFPGIGIALAAGIGMVVGLAVALLRKSREWKQPSEQRPHYHERPKGEAHKHH